MEQTLDRFRFILGEKATDEEVRYCATPILSLLTTHSQILDKSRTELDKLNQLVEDEHIEL